VSSKLLSAASSENLNIFRLLPLNLLKLLMKTLPHSWFLDDPSSLVVNCQDKLTNEWLISLWNYILETNSFALFDGIFPLLPVVCPTDRRGNLLSKVSAKAPVLHMSYKAIGDEAICGLADIGVYVFDPSLLGTLSYSKVIESLLIPSSPRAVLDALSVVNDIRHISVAASQWSTERRDAMKCFLLDYIVHKLPAHQPLDREDIDLIRSFPVWRVHDINEQTALSSEYTAITDSLYIPPKDIDLKLLDSNFIRLRNETDRILLKKLVMAEPSKGSFMAEYILPEIDSHKLVNYKEAISIDILKCLPQLEEDCPGISVALRITPFVKCANDIWSSPTELYDYTGDDIPLIYLLSLISCLIRSSTACSASS
jgi:hypothetical protein